MTEDSFGKYRPDTSNTAILLDHYYMKCATTQYMEKYYKTHEPLYIDDHYLVYGAEYKSGGYRMGILIIEENSVLHVSCVTYSNDPLDMSPMLERILGCISHKDRGPLSIGLSFSFIEGKAKEILP